MIDLEHLALFKWSCIWMTSILISTCFYSYALNLLIIKSVFPLFQGVNIVTSCQSQPNAQHLEKMAIGAWKCLPDVAEDQEYVNKWRRVWISSSSGDAVAARNGLWVTLRYKPGCAAAVQPESATCLPAESLLHWVCCCCSSSSYHIHEKATLL